MLSIIPELSKRIVLTTGNILHLKDSLTEQLTDQPTNQKPYEK